LSQADIAIDFFEDVSTGVCTGAFEHTSRCSNQTSGDGYCDCLADAANLCAKKYDMNWWAFIACMFAHNGSPDVSTGTGLASDKTFESTVQTCATKHLSYSFDKLKECYTGAEGSTLGFTSAAKTDSAHVAHPMWVYIDGQLVATPGHPPYTKDVLAAWAKQVKAKILAGSAAVSV
jgi:hypothetical protein